jgi:hypothetical protein
MNYSVCADRAATRDLGDNLPPLRTASTIAMISSPQPFSCDMVRTDGPSTMKNCDE